MRTCFEVLLVRLLEDFFGVELYDLVEEREREVRLRDPDLKREDLERIELDLVLERDE